MSKKIVSVALSLVMVATLVASVPAAKAQSTTDLQAQISALLAQIAQLQSQLNGTGGSTSTSCSAFSRNLTVGSTGTDVKALQVFLNGHGAVIAASGVGSVGNESSYFGNLTKVALAKFQAANGISPAVGYFGAITRAKVNSMCTTTTPGGTPGTTPVPGAGLSISLSSLNPSAGTLISSAASAASRVPVLAVNLTAGTASGITVNGLSFAKNGVLSDSSISGAYLVENGRVLSQYNSITSGKVVFTGLGLNVAAGQTRTVYLAIDPATNLSAGNTVSFSLASASDVQATDANSAAAVVSGSFPMSGNIFTVSSVSNPSLATLTIASSSIGTSVTAGTNNNIVGAWSFTAGNSKVWLKSINFKVIGSANKSDLKNVALFVNGAQVGSSLSSVAADGTAYFDLTSASASLNTGSNSVEVHADVAGSPSYNFQFELLNSYDVLAVDSQYNVPVTTNSNTGTQVTIAAGSISLQVSSQTPTGNIAAGQSGVTIASFTFYSAGESTKIKWLSWGLTFTGATLGIDSQVRNVSLVDDAGGQLGSTVNTLSTSVTCSDNNYSNSTSSYVSCFGSSGSPINYIVPANTTRTLYLKGDIQSTADFTSVVGKVLANTNNVQGLTSSQTASTAAANGALRNRASSALTPAKNSAVGTANLTPGSSNVRIGSYVLSASSAEGVRVSTLNILTGAATSTFQNLKVMVTNGSASAVQFGNMVNGAISAATTYGFSGTPFTIAVGGNATVDVYADITPAAVAGTKSTVTTLSGCGATGATSNSNVTCTSTAGQDVLIGGQATLTVSAASGQLSDKIVMGTTGNTLASFILAENTNVEDVSVTSLNVFQQVASTTTVKPTFSNLALYVSGSSTPATGYLSSYSTAASTSNPGAGYYWKFTFNNPLTVPQNGQVNLLLKGDVNTYTSSNATDNTTHVFKIATSTDTDNDTTAETVVAAGATSHATSAVTLSSATGPTKTVLRTKLTMSVAASNGSALSRSAGWEIGKITFTADAAGSAHVNTVTVTFAGNAASSATFLGNSGDGVTLVDEAGTVLGTANTSSTGCDGTSGSTCSKTFKLGTSVEISAGTSRTLTLKINGTTLPGPTSNTAYTLTAYVNAASDVAYTDARATDTTGSANISVTLPTGVTAPYTINTQSTAVGS